MISAVCIAQAGAGKSKDPAAPDKGSANDPTLVAWWTLDETSGDTANDTSVGTQHGKLKGGPVWTKGHKAGALEFDGKDDYVAITKAFFNKRGIAAMTVAAWIRTSSLNNQVIVSFDRNEYWQLEVNGALAKNGQAGWTVVTDAGQLNLASRVHVNDGQWHHVAGVFDNGLGTLYVDGVADAVKTTGRSCGNGDKRYGFLGVGSQADKYDGAKLPGTYFAGDMDDVRVYSRALTKSEIVQLSFFGPANDDCQFAEPINEVTNLAFDTTEASADGQGLCMISPNLWYVYAPSATGVATVSLLGSQYDTMLSIYRGADCSPGPDRLIGCNDDFSGLQSQLTFDAVGGQLYLVEVGGWSRYTGQGVLTISLEATERAEADLGDAPDSTGWTKRMTAYPDSGQGAVQAHFPTVFEDTDNQPRGPVHLAPRVVVYLGPAVSLENEANQGVDEDVVNNINQIQDKADQDGADDGVV
ncbi:MAG: LamG domain-containing protein, partial [Sedimentisphaerales bacterium]|nr:LamG domain-containing protein [Sedimentisphaerales bacterium]